LRVKFENMKEIAQFVRLCEQFSEEIDVTDGRYIVNGKSIMGVSMISVSPNINATIITDNENKVAEFEEVLSPFDARYFDVQK